MSLKLKKDETPEEKREKDICEYGEAFFRLLNSLIKEHEGMNIGMLGIKSVTDRVFELYMEKKAVLCEIIDELDPEDAELLTRLVISEICHMELIKCYEVLERVEKQRYFNNRDIIILKSFFYYLESFLDASVQEWIDEEEVKSGINGYFSGLASSMERFREACRKEILTVRRYEDCPYQEYEGTLLEVHHWNEKLLLLRKLKLIDRFINSFRENSQGQSGWGYSFIYDEKVTYFKDVF